MAEKARALALVFGLLAMVAVGAVRAIILQTTKHSEMRMRSLANYIRRVKLPPPRGRIFDRHGRVLGDDEIRFRLVAVLERGKLDSGLVGSLEELLDMNLHPRVLRHYGYAELAEGLTFEEATRVAERSEKFKRVLIIPYTIRKYRDFPGAGHIVGYLDKHGVGKAGIERSLEEILKGYPGIKYLAVDAKGRLLAEDPFPQEEPVPGEDITLTVDLELMEVIDRVLAPYPRAAAVVLDVRTGEILALYSKPDFDPNLLNYGIPKAVWDSLRSDPARPLLNRAVGGLYPPGSVFKILTALVALEAGAITPNTVFCCGGRLVYGGHTWRCWARGGHGCLDLVRAIAHSCDVYFYRVGLSMGTEGFCRALHRLDPLFGGYGLGVDGEKAWFVPTPGWYRRRMGEVPGWAAINLAIGQGEVLMTPLHLAVAAGLVGAGGRMPKPHLIKKIGNLVVEPDTLVLPIRPENIQAVRQGMLGVVEYGTARKLKIPGVKYAGKTGTAQNPHGRDHSLFACFGPYDEPKYAIAVVCENAGSGSGAAAPAARAILAHLLGVRPPAKGPEPPPERPEIEIE